ncbi:lysophospholipid acyltransferase family protein [Jannaschia sp. S6380]|uniref:lysophospholipid acyltransferase family protein n=1 Tax=Jannaschia sp. S6380 TaxID=2926408 RepID=UPI001FF3E994|nr:lysophospholipid acyltransferase family protein [Jannaschia sp. S6380]MCK0166913.1 lysophospholipid acyltransferase family protein [Jannaschia sp. S6380]
MIRDATRDITYAHSARTRRGRAVIRGLESLTGRPDLLRRARGYERAVADGADFWEEMCRRYGLRLELVSGGLDLIPAEGPVVLVANHPYGILDGLMLALILSRTRPDGFRILANDVFLRAPDLGRTLLPVSFDATRGGQTRNLAMRKAAIAFLRDGGAIGVFPGGAVSTAARPFGPARDPEWGGFTARLIHASGATVVPIHFEGANSRLFHLASHVHSTLRLGLLLREFRARTDGPVRVTVGHPVPAPEIARHGGNRRALMAFLRERTYSTGRESPDPGFDFETQKAGCT